MSDKEKDREAEQAILSSLLRKPEIYKNMDLAVNDFYYSEHRELYQMIGQLYEDGFTVDLVSLGAELSKKGLLGNVGGMKYIDALTNENLVLSNWKSYVHIVKLRSAFRRFRELSPKVQKLSANGTEVTEAVNEIYEEIRDIRGLIGVSDMSITHQVREWVLATSGHFFVTSCYSELGLVTNSHKKAARMALLRIKEEGIIVECGDKRGCYRTVEHDAPEIDWQDADINTVYDLKWPFALQEVVNIYPKNIIILAGSSNAGKTAFLLNFVKMNLEKHKIRFLSSEMGPEEMKLRITKFDDYTREFWKSFKPRERAGNFADAISPSQINIIDYFEISDNFYAIGGELRAIHDKLKTGIAIIAIQKKGNQELGRGAEFSLEKPRLYLSMDSGELKIVKGKNWAKPGWNPNGMTFRYKLINGCEFLEIPE